MTFGVVQVLQSSSSSESSTLVHRSCIRTLHLKRGKACKLVWQPAAKTLASSLIAIGKCDPPADGSGRRSSIRLHNGVHDLGPGRTKKKKKKNRDGDRKSESECSIITAITSAPIWERMSHKAVVLEHWLKCVPPATRMTAGGSFLAMNGRRTTMVMHGNGFVMSSKAGEMLRKLFKVT